MGSYCRSYGKVIMNKLICDGCGAGLQNHKCDYCHRVYETVYHRPSFISPGYEDILRGFDMSLAFPLHVPYYKVVRGL